MADKKDRCMAEVDSPTTKHNMSKGEGCKSEGWSMKKFFILEVIVMTPIVLVTIGVFLIPFVLYALPPSNPPPPPSSNSSEMAGDGPMSDNGFNNVTGPIRMCSQGFFLDDEDRNGRNATNSCKPACGEFLRKPVVQVVFEDIAICGSLIACVLMFIMACTVQRKTLLVFPSIINVYICISSFIFSFILFVGILDNFGLYCGGEKDLLFILGKGNESSFTTIAGLAFGYFVVQFDAWGTMQAFFLFWSVKYPFSYRSMKVTGKLRRAHIIGVLVIVLAPLPGPLFLLIDGLSIAITDNPSLAAFGRNPDHFFYIFTVPATTLLASTTILLEFIFWTIFQEFVLKKMLAKKSRDVRSVGKAEFKVMVIIIFYAFFGIMGLASTVYLNQNVAFQNSVAAHIGCEISGMPDCLQVVDAKTNRIVSALLSTAFSSLLLWPVIIIIFTIDLKRYKMKCKLGRKKTATGSSVQTTSSRKTDSSAV